MKFHISILVLLSTLILGISCNKNETYGVAGIPTVPVNYTLYLNNPSFIGLNAVGGSVYLDGGSKGLILHRYSNDGFIALERHCTYKTTEQACAVAIDSTTYTNTVCKCCNSKYILATGGVMGGPSTQPLLQYRTSYDANGNILQISN